MFNVLKKLNFQCKRRHRCKITKVKYKLTVYFNLKKKISSSSANYKGLASNTAQTQTITMYSTQVMVSKYYVSVNGTKDSLENG